MVTVKKGVAVPSHAHACCGGFGSKQDATQRSVMLLRLKQFIRTHMAPGSALSPALDRIHRRMTTGPRRPERTAEAAAVAGANCGWESQSAALALALVVYGGRCVAREHQWNGVTPVPLSH